MFMKRVFLSFIICVLFAGSVFAAISDSDFFGLCEKGSLQQINDAIKNGANVNARDRSSATTPLLIAARFNPDPSVITALTNAGADVNAQDRLGNTPLIVAIINNPNPGVITALVRAGSDINEKKNMGMTPLMFAALNFNNSEAIITTLLELGANPRLRNDFGNMAIDMAMENRKLRNTEAHRILEEASR